MHSKSHSRPIAMLINWRPVARALLKAILIFYSVRRFCTGFVQKLVQRRLLLSGSRGQQGGTAPRRPRVLGVTLTDEGDGERDDQGIFCIVAW
jgi:hypothetical protein